jgi:hypothetical protein
MGEIWVIKASALREDQEFWIEIELLKLWSLTYS